MYSPIKYWIVVLCIFLVVFLMLPFLAIPLLILLCFGVISYFRTRHLVKSTQDFTSSSSKKEDKDIIEAEYKVKEEEK